MNANGLSGTSNIDRCETCDYWRVLDRENPKKGGECSDAIIKEAITANTTSLVRVIFSPKEPGVKTGIYWTSPKYVCANHADFYRSDMTVLERALDYIKRTAKRDVAGVPSDAQVGLDMIHPGKPEAMYIAAQFAHKNNLWAAVNLDEMHVHFSLRAPFSKSDTWKVLR